jgi:lauroyl/myristoyl acyltransferase
LRDQFDIEGPHAQKKFFLRRGLATGEAADRILRARSALRDGLAIYLNGDIPWPGANARSGSLLGQTYTFLSVWADLAVLTGAPVIFMLAQHGESGSYHLNFSESFQITQGQEQTAIDAYLRHLETMIMSNPADAVAHLTWPCFGPTPTPLPCERAKSRIEIDS